jgi:hypothetical protein
MKPQTSQSDGLAEIFDVDHIEITGELIPAESVESDNLPVVIEASAEKEKDFQYVRVNLYDLIEKGTGAVHGALAVASESQHPRAYEVAGNLIKNVADLTDKLVALQKTKSTLDGTSGRSSVTEVNVDKAVFVGSTAELLKALKKHDASE